MLLFTLGYYCVVCWKYYEGTTHSRSLMDQTYALRTRD
jgi:hypothetical protein